MEMVISSTSNNQVIAQPDTAQLNLDKSLEGQDFKDRFEGMVEGKSLGEMPKSSTVGTPPVSMELVKELGWLSDPQVDGAVKEFVGASEGPLVPALYEAADVDISHEGWTAVIDFVGSKVSGVMDVVDSYLSGGKLVEDGLAHSNEPIRIGDALEIQSTTILLDGIEQVQDRLGVSDTPQGQAVSIASASVNILSQSLAAAIANPEAGMSHLKDVQSTFETLSGTLVNVHDASGFQNTETFLENSVVTVTNIEVLNHYIVDDLVDGIDIPQADIGQVKFLIDPGVPEVRPELVTMSDTLLQDSIVGDQGDDGLMLAEGETPFFDRSFSEHSPTEIGGELSVEIDAADLPGTVDLNEFRDTNSEGADLGMTTGFAEIPEIYKEYLAAEGGMIEVADGEELEGASDASLSDAPLTELETSEVQEVFEEDATAVEDDVADVSADLAEDSDPVEIDSDPEIAVDDFAATPWYERPISVDLFKVEELGEGVSEIYTDVVANADQIVGEDGFLDTGVMTGFAAYLEELGGVLVDVTPEEAAAISDILAPLLLDLDQGLFQLEQMGLTDSALYGATQVMAEVLGAVFYGGKIADNNPAAGAEVLGSIEPQISLLGNIFGEIVDGYAASGEVDASLFNFFVDAKEAASDVYRSVYNLSVASSEPIDTPADAEGIDSEVD
jgi:hypothetical protein